MHALCRYSAVIILTAYRRDIAFRPALCDFVGIYGKIGNNIKPAVYKAGIQIITALFTAGKLFRLVRVGNIVDYRGCG